jgi:hypothetical protein
MWTREGQLTSARADCRSALYVLATSNYTNRSDDPVRAAQVGSAARRALHGARGAGGPCAAVARPTASTPATRAPSPRSAATALWARAPVVMLSSKTRTLWARSQPGSMPGASSNPWREATRWSTSPAPRTSSAQWSRARSGTRVATASAGEPVGRHDDGTVATTLHGCPNRSRSRPALSQVPGGPAHQHARRRRAPWPRRRPPAWPCAPPRRAARTGLP